MKVVAGDALCANPCGAPAGTRRERTALAVTLSLKVMTIGESTGTPVAPLAGVVLVTDGAVSLAEAVVNVKLKFAAIGSGDAVGIRDAVRVHRHLCTSCRPAAAHPASA